MKHNLFVNYYTDRDSKRTQELDFCLLENINNSEIDSVVLICKQSDFDKVKSMFPNKEQHKSSLLKINVHDSLKKVVPIITDKRPTYNDYFQLMTDLFPEDHNINIIGNLDIVIPSETLTNYREKSAKDYLTAKNKCLALCRWDAKSFDYKNDSTFLDFVDSQDSWFFIGSVPQLENVDFGTGIAGCDNAIADRLEKAGYDVLNPSRTLKTYHIHMSDVRNYTGLIGDDIYRIPPPHKTLQPTL